MYKQVASIVGKEGLVGLQKLEAEGVIKPDFARRVGNIYKRDAVDSKLSQAIARGIGWHSDVETILEMIDWLRDGDYLVDYGELTVSLAISEKREAAPTLAESKFWQALDYFRHQIDDENDIFCVDFLLDRSQYFSARMNARLSQLKKKQKLGEDRVVVKTSCGYSYVYADDVPKPPEGATPYMETCTESGMHYNRYRGYVCSD